MIHSIKIAAACASAIGSIFCGGPVQAAVIYQPLMIAYAAPSAKAEFQTCDEMMYVNCSTLRLRTSPSLGDSNVAGSLSLGTRVQRVGKNDTWSILLVNGVKRYAASRYLSINPPSGSGQVSGGKDSAGTAAQATAGKDSAVTAEQASGSKDSAGTAAQASGGGTEISLASGYQYAGFSKINSGKAVLYKSTAQNRKNKTVCVNAGHGTAGGSSVKTLCHPDGSPKVTGGTTGAGATTAVAVSSGMTFADGTPESRITLKMARLLKGRLLAEGYDVLMIRESDDVQLDNIARTVIANNNADCHIALHWDATSSDKGCFFMSVPDNATYRAMEPVASHWQDHDRLGEALIKGLKGAGNKIFAKGSMATDLTQTSYSTIPSVDIELGDKISDHSDQTLNRLADGLVAGINTFFGYQ